MIIIRETFYLFPNGNLFRKIEKQTVNKLFPAFFCPLSRPF